MAQFMYDDDGKAYLEGSTCGHGSTIGFCDRGGCDELSWHKPTPRTRHLTKKQHNWLKAMLSSKDLSSLTAEQMEKVERCREIYAANDGKVPTHYFGYPLIDLLKGLPNKSATKVAAQPVVAAEEASSKQKGFIRSLVAKREVPADVMAQVEAALLSKAKASQLIGLLTTLPEKANA